MARSATLEVNSPASRDPRSLVTDMGKLSLGLPPVRTAVHKRPLTLRALLRPLTPLLLLLSHSIIHFFHSFHSFHSFIR